MKLDLHSGAPRHGGGGGGGVLRGDMTHGFVDGGKTGAGVNELMRRARHTRARRHEEGGSARASVQN